LDFSASLKQEFQTVKQNKDGCAELMEKTHQLLEAIISVHMNSELGGELPPSVLSSVGNFTRYVAGANLYYDLPLFRTLHKIHTFVEAQQSGSKIKKIFHRSEMSTLLKDCKAGLQQGFESFQASSLFESIAIC
jgi:hypothetical protein